MTLLALLLCAVVAVPATAGASPPPLDPQHVQDQSEMTWDDYRPIPISAYQWATNGARPTERDITIALVAFDFDDQPFVMTQPKHSDPFGNPQIDPVPRDEIPQFYADFFSKPSPLNHYTTINGYWMEQSGGRMGITKIDTYGPYRMPKKLYQYGLNDIGQNHAGCGGATCGPQGDQGDGCPATTTAIGAQSAATTIAVESSDFFYVGDVITIAGASPSGGRTVTAIPDATHITISRAVTLANGAAIEDCVGSSFNTDAMNLWHQEANCSGNCGATIHLFIYAGYDETSVWQEFGEMMFQTKEDIPREVWGNPNPRQPTWVVGRYTPWTSYLAGHMQWGESSVRQGESSGTITHEISHNVFSPLGDNNNNPYLTPYHRVGSGTWDMMDRGSFNGPGGGHNRWQVPAQHGASMGAEHTLRNKIGMNFTPNSTVLRLNRDGLADSGLAVADIVARAVNADPLAPGVRAGAQIFLDGAAPVDHEPDCDVDTDPLCDGGGPRGNWTNYTVEAIQRIGQGSFEPDNGVMIAKNKEWLQGGRSREGATCGYNCFTWVIDAHPEDIDRVDFYRPDGTPVMRTIADSSQLNDALFHAGTNSGSQNEWADPYNDLHFYIVDTYVDDDGIEHYVVGVQNPAGAGPQQRGVALAPTSAGPSEYGQTCTFTVTNTGTDAGAAPDPALHPQDETASTRYDIYRLEASAAGSGWTAELRNNLLAARFGESKTVPVYISRAAGSAANGVVTLKATSVSDPAKTATATCGQADVGGTVAATLSLSLDAPASFGTFAAGVANDYRAATTADVISTAGDATLSVSDPSSVAPGHLVNGAFKLAKPLQVRVPEGSGAGDFADLGASALALTGWSEPISNATVPIEFNQAIGAADPLRTGTYAKTLTFTLSTTNP